MWRGAWFDFKVLPIYGRWSPPEWYAPPVFPLQQEPHTVNDGWRALAFVCISCALVQQMQKGCLKGITKINCLTVRFAGHSWWHQNRRAWSMSSSHCSHYQWHSVCHIPFFESLSIPNPNGRAAITWFSLTFFFWHFFDNPSGTACVILPVLKVWYSDYYIDFFWPFFLWHSFFEKNQWHRVWHTVCWKSRNLESCCDDGTMTYECSYVGTKQRQGGDHMTTRLRRHDDDTVATWRHGHDMSNCRQSIATLPARSHTIDTMPMSSSHRNRSKRYPRCGRRYSILCCHCGRRHSFTVKLEQGFTPQEKIMVCA